MKYIEDNNIFDLRGGNLVCKICDIPPGITWSHFELTHDLFWQGRDWGQTGWRQKARVMR